MFDRIVVEFIDQSQQRYPTAGDWFHEGDTLVLKISRMSKEAFTYALTLHELTEALACKINGVSQEAVDAFDTGPGADLDEPGDSDLAPYKLEHAWASVCERVFIGAVGEHWNTYDDAFADLDANQPHLTTRPTPT